MQVTGHVTIAGHVTNATAEGAIELDLLGCRRVVYDLSWRNSEGLYSRFFGQKALRARRPIESWTTLKGHVHVGGALSGHATLRFDLRSLPAFLRTMRPLLR